MIKVLVPASPYFERDGENLILKKKVTASQAILGEKISVRTLNGFKEVILPPGTNSSDKIVLKGYGVPNMQTEEVGDLIIQINIVIPKKLTQAQKDALLAYRKIEPRAEEDD